MHEAVVPSAQESLVTRARNASLFNVITGEPVTEEQASAKIAQAARDILGDTDDISVAIIDVRQFR